MNKKITIIYDATALCPWNCSICCMGATTDSSCVRRELSAKDKDDLVRQIAELVKQGYDVRVDVSGGEIFNKLSPDCIFETKRLLSNLSGVLGKEKVGVSCSGCNIDDSLAHFLAETVSDVEMTMDVAPGTPDYLRPAKYAETAARAAVILKRAGVKVGLQTVVSKRNLGIDNALAVYAWACANKVDNWSIIRFFPSGRGAGFPDEALTDSECEQYVRMVQTMTATVMSEHKPRVDFHYLMPGHEKYTDVCRCVRHSIGILPGGDVVACFWALDSNTDTVEDKFLLGNVTRNSLSEILNSEKAHYWSDCEHHCELGSCEKEDYYVSSEGYNVLSA